MVLQEVIRTFRSHESAVSQGMVYVLGLILSQHGREGRSIRDAAGQSQASTGIVHALCVEKSSHIVRVNASVWLHCGRVDEHSVLVERRSNVGHLGCQHFTQQIERTDVVWEHQFMSS